MTATRRDFLRVSAALGGGLILGFRLPEAWAASTAAPNGPDGLEPNAFVRIARDGRVTVIINKAEMGQGVCTSLSMLLAEELDADWSKVGFEFAPVDPLYAHPGFGIQMTGGSSSVLGMSEPMRRAGAGARALLILAAAQTWGVPAQECSTEPGRVLHAGTNRHAAYGELVDAAAALEAPAEIALKDPKDFRIVGKSTPRLDTPDKVAGRATFGLDVSVPGMLTAVVLHAPVFGARARTIRPERALALKGVRRVVDVGSGVAIVADGFWPAKRGRDLLEVDWDLGPNAGISTEALHAEYAALARQPGKVVRKDGDAAAALASAGTARVIEADYRLPYLAHAPMEPLNCVVDLRPDSCEIWAGTQFQTVDHAAAAQTAGLDPGKVKLHTTYLGGGFGRRATPDSDYIVEAVKIAKAVEQPIKLVWTRDDDLAGGHYRPMWHSRLRAGLEADGKIQSWLHTIVGQSIIAGTPFEPFIVKNGIDGTSVEGAEDVPYAIPNVLVDLHTTQVGVPTLWWRSVGHSHTAFAVECFLDEIARAAGKDPLELRRELLKDKPRHAGVLELAAKQAGWATPLPKGRARGLAVHFSFMSYVAMVVEASIEAGRPRVHRVTAAVDCGRTVNPDIVVAQLEGAVGFGLTAALYGEITLEQGRVQQTNFHDYRMLRMSEMPAVDVHIVSSEEPSTGIGEPGVPPVAPALCNALFALTDKPIRRLPIRTEDLA
jgi:isoquinoline 1-oxidoreductase subunit beta